MLVNLAGKVPLPVHYTSNYTKQQFLTGRLQVFYANAADRSANTKRDQGQTMLSMALPEGNIQRQIGCSGFGAELMGKHARLHRARAR